MAKPVVAVSLHAASGETESDGNRGTATSLSSSDASNVASMDARASAAAPVHSAAAEQSWTVDSAGAAVAPGNSTGLQGAASELANTNPDTLQSLALSSQTAAPAAGEIPLTTAAVEMPLPTTVDDVNAGAVAPIRSDVTEQSSTIDTTNAAVGRSDAASLEGSASEHGNDQPHLSAHADIPLAAAIDDANAGGAAHGHGAAAEHGPASDSAGAAVGHGNSASPQGAGSEHGNDQPHLSAHAAADVPLAAAIDDANAGGAAHGHGAAAEHGPASDSAGAVVGQGNSASPQGAGSEHGNDQPHLSAHVAADVPLAAAIDDANAGGAAHGHGAAAEHGPASDSASAAVGQGDSASLPGAASGHENDQPHLSAHAAADIPLAAAIDDANAGGAAHGHGAAAERGPASDSASAAVGHGDSASLQDAGSEHGNDQPHLSAHAAADVPLAAAIDDANAGGAAHGHGADPSQAAAPAAAEVLPAPADNGAISVPNDFNSAAPLTAVEDANVGAAAHAQGAAAEHASANAVGLGDSASLPGAASGHGNDQPHLGNATPDAPQSLELASQAAAEISPAAADTSAISVPNDFNSAAPPTAVEDGNAGAAAAAHGPAAQHSPAIDTVSASVGQGDSASLHSAAAGHGNDQPHTADNSAISLPDSNSPAAPTAVEDAPVHSAAAEHVSAIDTVGAAVAHGNSASPQNAASVDLNDQFHFAYTNPQSLDLANQVSLSSNLDSAASPTAVEDANGSAAAPIDSTAAEHLPTIDTASAALAHSQSASSQGAASGDMNDQFHFAYTNSGTLQSLELPNQAASPAAVEIPPVTTQLAQIVDDILTQAAQAPPDQNHDVASPNAHHDNPSNHFIIHA